MKRTLIILPLLVFFAACNRGNEDKPMQNEDFPVIIEPVITKATDTDFENGDAIGLSIIRDGIPYSSNVRFMYTDGCFSGDLFWYNDVEAASDIIAYYPYAEMDASCPEFFSVQTDQSEGCASSDFITGTKENVYPSKNAVILAFHHRFSKIRLTICNTTGEPLRSVALGGSIPRADLRESVKPDSDAQPEDITANMVRNDTIWQAIVVPQTVAFELKVTLASGKVLAQKMKELTLEQGTQYAISAVVMRDDINIVTSGQIEDWLDGGDIPGGEDPEPEEPEYVEHGDSFDYFGTNYRTVVLPDGNRWMAEPLAFLPRGINASEDPANGAVWYPYRSDGVNVTVLKDQASIKELGYLYSFNALMGEEITEENFDKLEGARGICPEGWHIPTRAEWFALCGSSTACVLRGESGTQINENAFFWDDALGYAPVAAFDASGFSFTFSGCIANNKYNVNVTDSSNCFVESYLGRNRMAYVASSTANSNTQYFALMTTFTSANNQGKVSLSYAVLDKCGVQVRCVKTVE